MQSPDAYNPIARDQKSALSRRSYVLDSMKTMGAITPAQATKANAAKIGLKPRALPTSGCTGVPADHNDWGFYCDYFVRWWDEQSAFGKTPQQRTNKLLTGGYHIVTPMQPNVQATALEQSVGVYGYDDSEGAADRGRAARHRPGPGHGGEPALRAADRPGRTTSRPPWRR